MMMAVSKRGIFREKALRYYAANKQKDVLPRLVSPPVFVFFWILLVLLLVAGIAAWLVQVPTYVTGTGVVLDQGIMQGKTASGEAVAVVFLPASRPMHMQAGQRLLLQIGSTGTWLPSRISHIDPGVISPDDARSRYRLSGTDAQAISGPSFVLTVNLGSAFPAHQYAGSMVSAQVQVGTQRVLSLLPGPGQLFGG